jgi:nicotinate-nucleotide adenylyltransferase
MKNKLIIVYGGAFNPPSLAHVTLAKQLLNYTNAEKLIFVPVGDQYKKEGLISAQHRVNMLLLACEDSSMEVSTIETNADRRLFTFETLDIIKENYKDKDICFIMGTDNLRDVINWKCCHKLLSEYKLVIMNRGSDTLERVFIDLPQLKQYKENFIQIQGLIETDINSTTIRDHIKEGKNITHLTTKAIDKYIKKEKLYL